MGSLTCATVLLLDMHAPKREVGTVESALAFTRKNLKSLYLPRPGVESSLGAIGMHRAWTISPMVLVNVLKCDLSLGCEIRRKTM